MIVSRTYILKVLGLVCGVPSFGFTHLLAFVVWVKQNSGCQYEGKKRILQQIWIAELQTVSEDSEGNICQNSYPRHGY